jgi:hypothetical protein
MRTLITTVILTFLTSCEVSINKDHVAEGTKLMSQGDYFLSLTRFLVFNNFVSAITGVSAIFFDFSKKFVGGTGFF